MHPRPFAISDPDRPAIILPATDQTVTYGQLEAAANRGAHLLRALGCVRGDGIALLMDNEAAIFELSWAAQRIGLYLTSISTKLSAADIAYILRDSGARILVASDRLASLAQAALAEADGVQGYLVDAEVGPLKNWSASVARYPDTPVPNESAGTDMLYSSGTTGRPKGVKPPLPEGPLDAQTALEGMGTALYGMGQDCIYLSTSPLYHAAPLRWAMTIHRLGGTVVVMDRFDAEDSLALIERYRITHATWVPTHFVRLLKLPEDVRARYDHGSLKAVIHAAAPCPVPVKQAMIDWWGPIVHEYYSGTECCGITALSSPEWLSRPGSVGRAVLGRVRIVGENGQEVAPGDTGDVFFSDGPTFTYHNDPDKTAAAHNDRGWATLGDVGHLDADGYLFLTDRRSFMIISGGVNIYPQEIENCLITHPQVADVAVIGVPDEEMGENILAIVQPAESVDGDAALTEELTRFVRTALGGVKTPRAFVFRADLPREPTGKLMKRRLIDEYRAPAATMRG
ncbi:acyl-CoA synthetase [Sphingobium limneticum]|uniref:Acyl-CoA synthetase n=1 Tax=Sphingobium limneticum TaxID=1007511 RepID=A0A5J5I5H8_9SPHN|nr:acyl-CoA synthetase [Sphingobium limneticum]KAA9018237.1 acyl-CoA synthetase [Sphingobium limneticum]KAA9030873.1 acyl-CoA synthetase [Sphingobium limneticum]